MITERGRPDAGSFCGAAELAAAVTGDALQLSNAASRTGAFSGHVDLTYG